MRAITHCGDLPVRLAILVIESNGIVSGVWVCVLLLMFDNGVILDPWPCSLLVTLGPEY